MDSVLSEEQFLCVICLDSFTNPVSIPCGHNFCLACIKTFWLTKDDSECPVCKMVFQNPPELRVNVGLRDITEKFKSSLKEKTENRPVPARRRFLRPSSTSDISSDVCHDTKQSDVKSCLHSQASDSETDLKPESRNRAKTDPIAYSTRHLCRNHNKPLEMFCRMDQTPVCWKCTEKDHKLHEVVSIETESERIKSRIKKSQEEIEQMIDDRIRKSEEIKHSLELGRINKTRETQTSIEVVTKAISALESNQALLIKELEQRHEAAESKAKELLNELEQETDELLKRLSELQSLNDTKDSLHLLQSFPVLDAPVSSKDWSEISIDPDVYMGAVRRSFSKIVEICHELEQKLSAEEVIKISKYATEVTLDPGTAAGWLDLSSDGKQVSVSSQHRKALLPPDPQRFDACVAVLGKQSFTSGRGYWVVQVGDKPDWDLGVAKESINRKGSINVSPANGYWAICRRKGGSVCACTGPAITLNLKEPPQKVGIFLDYEKGLVSFYNAVAKIHIYTYSGCIFTEPLYPYFNPCLHDNGKNMAPLIICPAEAGLTVDP